MKTKFEMQRGVCIKVCLITNSDVYRLEKRGTDIQNEAVPLALVMSGYLPTPQSISHQFNPLPISDSSKLISALFSTFNTLETKNSTESLAESDLDLFKILSDFVKYWNKLSQLTGLCVFLLYLPIIQVFTNLPMKRQKLCLATGSLYFPSFYQYFPGLVTQTFILCQQKKHCSKLHLICPLKNMCWKVKKGFFSRLKNYGGSQRAHW